MKKNSSISVGWLRAMILALACLLYGLLEPAYCRDSASQTFPPTDSTVLLLQQTPLNGGRIKPEVGVHHLELNAEVALTAVAKPGYRFLYWMGDVGDPTANNTIVYLDTPKIIIAVFERSEFEFLEEELQNTIGGGGGLRPHAGDYSNRGGGGANKLPKFRFLPWEQPSPPGPPEIPDEFPVPKEKEEEEQPDEFPVPLPEPTTALLLGLGGLLFVRCRTKK